MQADKAQISIFKIDTMFFYTKCVKKTANFAHIFRSALKNALARG